jgi:cytochrome P450
MYELARRPEEILKLRAGLAGCITDPNDEYTHETLAIPKHADDIINETLRIHSPTPSYIPRKGRRKALTLRASVAVGY